MEEHALRKINVKKNKVSLKKLKKLLIWVVLNFFNKYYKGENDKNTTFKEVCMKVFRKILLAAALLLIANVGAFAGGSDYELWDLGDMSFQEFSNYFQKAYSSANGADEIAEELFNGEFDLKALDSSEIDDYIYGLLGSLKKESSGQPKNEVLAITDGDFLIIVHNSWADYCWYPFQMY